MLEGVIGIKFGYVLCGIIWAVALGFAVGNYACSLVHRLPRGRLILDKKPYCGSCGAELQVKDLFPVVSALLLRHRCRYCGTSYPVSHTWTELLVGLLFVLTYLQYNFTEPMILLCAIGVFLITLAAIEANEKMIMGKILLCVIVSGALYRVLVDHSMYNFFQGGLLALIIGAVLWRKSIQKVGHIYVLPPQAQLLVVGGICVGQSKLPLFLALYAGFYAVFWALKKIRSSCGLQSSNTGSRADDMVITVPFGLAVMLPLLYPALFNSLFLP